MYSGLTHNSAPKKSTAIFLLVFFLFILILIFSGLSQIALLVGLLSIFIFFVCSFVVIRFLIPELTGKQVIRLISETTYWRSNIRKPLLSIVDGQLSEEQQLPSQQKHSWVTHIDPSSMAFIFRPSLGCELLSQGIHIIKKGTTLCAAFSLAPQKVVFGPANEITLSEKKGGEGLADYHSRISKARKTAASATDGKTLLPKIEVYYRIDAEKHAQEILQLMNRHVSQSISSGTIMTMKFLDDLLFKLIMEEWKVIAAAKPSSDIIRKTPFKLFQEERTKFGLVYQAYVCEIFGE